ncbi:uncharacterized protein [Anabrus simplex]|uniref:uncharacterized protein n=1 Tax=Anabrus simplex TaxID=316456 RepID=UPI0035A2A52D
MDEALGKECKMKINKSKTKVMGCSRTETGDAVNIRLGNEVLKEVDEYCYLGSKITKDGRSKGDLNCRLAQARKSFLKKLLTSNMDIGIINRFLKTFIWSVALYGSEKWTITSSEIKRRGAFEMWCYRRILKVSWIDRITNEEVLNRIGERRSIWLNLTKRSDRMRGHILRRPGLVQLVHEGSVGSKNGRGRPGYDYDKQIRADAGCNCYIELKKLARNKVAWRVASMD